MANISNRDLARRVIDTRDDHVPVKFRPTRPTLPIAPVPPVGTPAPWVPPPTPSRGADPSGKGGIPKILLALIATQNPVKQQSYTNSDVTINFVSDPSDTNFYGVDIWFVGYHGNSNAQLMSSGNTSPISFVCDSTGESVVVIAQTVSAAGMSAPLSFAAHTVVTLTGNTTAPPPPTIVQTLLATPTGYQFSFNFITGLLSDVIDVYRIYRNSSNTIVGATVVRTVAQDTNGNSSTFVFQDSVGSQGTGNLFYWVSAVNTAGLESSITPAQAGAIGYNGWVISPQYTSATVTVPNANFEASNTGIPGWFADAATISLYTAAPYSGSQSLQVNTSQQYGGGFTYQNWACSPGDRFFVSAAMKSDGVATPAFSVVFFDVAGNYTGAVSCNTGTSTSWGVYTGTGTAPANTVGMHLDCSNQVAGGLGVCYFDALIVDKLVSLDNNVFDGTTYGRVVQTGLTSGSIDPSKSGVLSRGNTPYSLTNGFTYTATTTSITISWSGLTIYRGDGTIVSITNGSQTITGLAASHTYYFYPYYNDAVGGLTFSWVAGGTGSPAYAQTAVSATLVQTQNLQSRIPLSSGGMPCTTPASGTGGGSGGGGGGGGCFTGNVGIKTPDGFVRFSDCLDKFQILNETGVHDAELLVHENYSGYLLDMGDDEYVTTGHMMKSGEAWIPAREYFPVPMIWFSDITVYNMHVLSDRPEDKHYILSNGHVAHNLFKTL